jgi:DNA-binding MarR family transcriptional regulator
MESELEALATRLHSAAIRLLRNVRREDRASGLTGPRLSALSVLVFGGPQSLAGLAEAEQVTPPTMSRLVDALVTAGLATREAAMEDRRQVRIAATAKGRRLLEEGRTRRVRALAGQLADLSPAQRATLTRATAILERAAR